MDCVKCEPGHFNSRPGGRRLDKVFITCVHLAYEAEGKLSGLKLDESEGSKLARSLVNSSNEH